MTSIRRRSFLTLLGASTAVRPLAARAQQPALPVIGVLSGNIAGGFFASNYLLPAFREGLRDSGYFEGQNVSVEYRWAEGQYERLPALAAELAGRRVSAIYASDNASAQATKTASSNIPIVFSVGADPVGLGLVASLARPGGNFTGAS